MHRSIRSLVPLFLLGLGQATLAIGMIVFVFGSEMSRFDTNRPAPPGERVAGVIAQALVYPLVPLVAQLPLALRPSGFPGEHLVFLVNGLIWGGAILALRRAWLLRAARDHDESSA